MGASATAGVGDPLAVIANDVKLPTMKLVAPGFVTTGAAGAAATVSMNGCVAFGSPPFDAVTVRL